MGKTIRLVGGPMDGSTAELKNENDRTWECIYPFIKGVNMPIGTVGRPIKVERHVYEIDPANPDQFNWSGCYPHISTDH